jgi:phospholipid/cholesterol/gamma-HCH transport system permease protein
MASAQAWINWLGYSAQAPLRWVAEWGRLTQASAALLVLTLSRASYRPAHRAAMAAHIYRDTAPLLGGYTLLIALLGMVLTRIVVTTAQSYGLSQYALEVLVRVLVLELIPLSAAMMVALRVTLPAGADLSRLRRRGVLRLLRERGVDALRIEAVPRVVTGLFATALLAALSSVVVMVLAYITINGFSGAGFDAYTRMFGRVFIPSAVLVFTLKILFFSLAVSLIPLASALYDSPRDPSRTRAEMRALVRMLVVLLLVEAASLVGNYY